MSRTGSISKAAASQFISAQALTQQINLLEQEVGAKLFERTTKGVSLTAAGEALRDGSQRILDLWEATLQHCREATPAHKCITTPMCLGFATAHFEEACQEYRLAKTPDEPDLRFVIDDNYKDWINGLHSGAYDFIRYVCVGGVHPMGMYFEPIRELTPWALMDPGHPLAGKEIIQPEELAGSRIAVSDKRVVRKLFEYLEARGLPPNVHEIPVSRMHVMDALREGSLCIFSKNFVRGFEGCPFSPIDFDIENQEGLLCHERDAAAFGHLFEILHRHLEQQEL